MASADRALLGCDGHSIDGRGTDHRRGERLQAVRRQPGADARLARRRWNARWYASSGPSGSGKTTLLRCLALLEEPSEGRVVMNGNVDRHARRRCRRCKARGTRRCGSDIGMVFQHFNLWPHMSVLENLIEAPMRVKKHAEGPRPSPSAETPAGEGRPRRQARRLSGAPVGRPAAARRDRPRARHVAQGDAVRRADLARSTRSCAARCCWSCASSRARA